MCLGGVANNHVHGLTEVLKSPPLSFMGIFDYQFYDHFFFVGGERSISYLGRTTRVACRGVVIQIIPN